MNVSVGGAKASDLPNRQIGDPFTANGTRFAALN